MERGKGVVREIEDENGVLIFDDTIQEKKWTKRMRLLVGIMTIK